MVTRIHCLDDDTQLIQQVGTFSSADVHQSIAATKAFASRNGRYLLLDLREAMYHEQFHYLTELFTGMLLSVEGGMSRSDSHDLQIIYIVPPEHPLRQFIERAHQDYARSDEIHFAENLNQAKDLIAAQRHNLSGV